MDYKYWNSYYAKQQTPLKPTQFAKDIIGYLKYDKKLLELGCGNGRDSIYFRSNNLEVSSVDQSDIAIQNLKEKHKDIEFVVDNFITTKLFNKKFDYIYSRFTLHSITAEEEKILLRNVYESLSDKGMFFIEARSVKDEIYGLGEEVDRNVFIYNGHRRRFIVMEELIGSIKEVGFEIIVQKEADNLAVYKEENPVVVRLVCKKI